MNTDLEEGRTRAELTTDTLRSPMFRPCIDLHEGKVKQIGGGVTSENAALWLDAGASHVIVTSWGSAEFQVGNWEFTAETRRRGGGGDR